MTMSLPHPSPTSCTHMPPSPPSLLSLVHDDLSRAALYLLLRNRFFRAVVDATDLFRCGGGGGRTPSCPTTAIENKLELIGNVFSRFYVTARNGVVPYEEICRKMVDELEGRGLGVPRAMSALSMRAREEKKGDDCDYGNDYDEGIISIKSAEEFLRLFMDEEDGINTSAGSGADEVESVLAKLGGLQPSSSSNSDRCAITSVEKSLAAAVAEKAVLLNQILPLRKKDMPALDETDDGDIRRRRRRRRLVSYEFHPGDPAVPALSLSVESTKHDELLRRATEYLSERSVAGVESPRRRQREGAVDDDDDVDYTDVLTPDLLLRTTALSYLPSSGFLYWGFGPSVYSYARRALNATFELYASPFNSTLDVYCSPFELDKVFGSLGSLYRVDWDAVLRDRRYRQVAEEEGCGGGGGGEEGKEKEEEKEDFITFIANPPYVEAEIGLCADVIGKILESATAAAGTTGRNGATQNEKRGRNVLVLSIGPPWYWSDSIQAMQNISPTQKSPSLLSSSSSSSSPSPSSSPTSDPLEEDSERSLPSSTSSSRDDLLGLPPCPRKEWKFQERELAPEDQRYYNYQTLDSVQGTHTGLAFVYANFEPADDAAAVVLGGKVEKFYAHMGDVSDVSDW